MPWFKVDDKLHDHRKARAAGATAMGVWLLAGSWAADNLTDGFIPASVLSRWGRPRDAKRLVDVGFWHEAEQDGEIGWRFHEWLERQPSRAQKLAEREARAEAGRLGGQASGRSRREANTKQVASDSLEPPTRPDPTRPSTPDGVDRFDEFWEAYPRREGKGQARRAWKTAIAKIEADALIAAAAEFARWCVKEQTERRYIALPTTWLNGERWLDERAAGKSKAEPRRPTADQLEQPPDGLSPEQYSKWLAERRAG